jgi:hypothetical protein
VTGDASSDAVGDACASCPGERFGFDEDGGCVAFDPLPPGVFPPPDPDPPAPPPCFGGCVGVGEGDGDES